METRRARRSSRQGAEDILPRSGTEDHLATEGCDPAGGSCDAALVPRVEQPCAPEPGQPQPGASEPSNKPDGVAQQLLVQYTLLLARDGLLAQSTCDEAAACCLVARMTPHMDAGILRAATAAAGAAATPSCNATGTAAAAPATKDGPAAAALPAAAELRLQHSCR